MRRSVSLIQTSIRLAVATSLLRSQSKCVRRKNRTSSRLSVRSSESILSADKESRSLSLSRCSREISPNGPKRPSTNLSCTFGDNVSHAKDLIGLLIQKQIVVTETGSSHVPVKILRLQAKSKDIGKDSPQLIGNLFDRFASEIGG